MPYYDMPAYENAVQRWITKRRSQNMALPQAGLGGVAGESAGQEMANQLRLQGIGQSKMLGATQQGLGLQRLADQATQFERNYGLQQGAADFARRQNEIANWMNLAGLGLQAYSGYQDVQAANQQSAALQQRSASERAMFGDFMDFMGNMMGYYQTPEPQSPSEYGYRQRRPALGWGR